MIIRRKLTPITLILSIMLFSGIVHEVAAEAAEDVFSPDLRIRSGFFLTKPI